MTRIPRLIAASLALALATAACGGSRSTHASSVATSTATTASAAAVAGTSTAAASQSATVRSGHTTVTIKNYMFLPMHLTVRAGTRVSFHNEDQTAHTATATRTGFDSGTINPGKTGTVTFRKPGTFAYHCLFHAFMTATITVVPAGA